MFNSRFTRAERLSNKRAIDRLFNDSRKGFTHPIRYLFNIEDPDRNEQPVVSVLITVSKKLHKRANKRNLLKRRIREAYRINKHPLTEIASTTNKKINIALIYTTKEVEDFKKIDDVLKKIISRITANV